jgi:hypothetical protein
MILYLVVRWVFTMNHGSNVRNNVMNDAMRACWSKGFLVGRVVFCIALFCLLPARVAFANPDPPSLGLVWDGLNGDSTMGSSWVSVYAEGKLVFQQEFRFTSPMIVKDVPVGRVQVIVLPRVCEEGFGYTGVLDVDVAKSGMTTARVALTKCEGVKVTVAIRDIDKSPFTGTVQILDVTDKEFPLQTSANVPRDGELSFQGYAGRTYRLAVVRTRPQILTYRSTPIVVAKDMQPTTWQITLGPMLHLRFWLNTEAGLRPIEIPCINVRRLPPPQIGWGGTQFTLGAKELALSKSKGLLAGAKTVELVYVSQNEDDDYVIAKNSRITLNNEEEQIVDVVMVPKAAAGISVAVGGLDNAAQLMLYAIHADTKYKYGLTAGQERTVLPGNYTIRAWHYGYRLATREVATLMDETTNVTVEMKPAPVYRIQVAGHAGRAVIGAAVVPIYPAELGIPKAAQRTDRVGQVSVAIDDGLDAWLAIITPAMGARIVPLSPRWRDEVGKIELAAPCPVIGEVGLAKELESGIQEVGWSVMWVTAQRPKVVIYASKVIDGKYSGILQPGEYIPYLVHEHEAIALPAVHVKADERKKTIKRVKITVKEWENRKPLWERDFQ